MALFNKTYTTGVDFIQAMGIKYQLNLQEIERNEQTATYLFEYQGASFIAQAGIKNNELILRFNYFEVVLYSPANFAAVQSLCNLAVRNYRYIKMSYTYDAEHNNICLHQSVEVPRCIEEDLLMYIDGFFTIAAQARAYLQGHPDSEDFQCEQLRDQRLLLEAEQRLLDTKHKHKYPRAIDPNHGTLGEYIQYLFGREIVGNLNTLSVETVKDYYTIEEKDKIANFDLMDCLITDANDEVHFIDTELTTLTLDTGRCRYILTLQPLHEQDDALYVRLSAMRLVKTFNETFGEEGTYQPQTISVILSYIKKDLELNDGEELQMSNLEKQLHHGHLLMQRKCFVQAIAVLTPVYERLRDKVYKGDQFKEQLMECCYVLGYCYNDLHQYDRAYSYLEICHQSNRIDYSMEFINCLTENHDFRVFHYLHNEMDAVRDAMIKMQNQERKEEGDQQQYESWTRYLNFLKRRLGYSQINFDYLDEAEKTFTSLLEDDESKEYAENELAYIQQLKNKAYETTI